MKKILLTFLMSFSLFVIGTEKKGHDPISSSPLMHAEKSSRNNRKERKAADYRATKPTVVEKIGQRVIIGFHGTSQEDPEVTQLISYVKKGFVGGVIFFSYNILSKEQVTSLINSLKGASNSPLLVCIDHEGGKVQRLTSEKGFTRYLSAHEVAQTMSPDQARIYYEVMAEELKEIGFNCTFGPVLDLHADETTQRVCPAIGGLHRAFSSDVKTIVAYAQAFIEGHRKQGILTCLKHYPGHGLALLDTHISAADITTTYKAEERLPFKTLIQNGYDEMVMVAHIRHKGVDATYPASLSKKFITEWLHSEDGFKGVVVADDLFMGAIQAEFGFKEVVLTAIRAEADLLIFSNNPSACKGFKTVVPDSMIPEKISRLVSAAAKKRMLNMRLLDDSYERIMRLKKKISS